jgi:CHAT domain-containing protein/Tfp pilus assembly protein PilF
MRKIFSIMFVFPLIFSIYLPPNQKKEELLLNEQYLSALKLIGEAKYDQARDELKDIIKKDVTFSKAYGKILWISIYENKLDSAKDYFEQLLEENKENPGAFYGLGMYYYEKEDFAKALENCKKAIEYNTNSPAFYTYLINSLQKLNQLDRADEYINNIIEIEPNNASAHYGMGFLYFKQQKWDEAMEYLDKAVELNPELLLAYRVKCDVYKASSKYKEMLELASDKVKLCEGRDPDLQIDFYTRISSAYGVLGKYQEDLEYNEKALNLSREIGNRRNEGIILGNIGVYFAQTGDYQQALKYFHQKLAIVKELSDESEEAHILTNIGVISDWKGDTQEALEWYKKALKIIEELDDIQRKAWILGNIGAAYEKLSDYPKALDCYRQALKIFQDLKNRGDEAWILGNIAAIAAKLGNDKEALENFELALKIMQEVGDKKYEGWILGTIGATYKRLGETEKSFEYLNKALDIAREIGDKRLEISHLGNLGSNYQEVGEFDKSEDCLSQGLTIAEQIGDKLSATELLIIMGILHRDLKDHDKSIDDFDKALRIGNEISAPRTIWNAEWGLALSYEKNNDFSEAIKHYKNAINTIESVRSKLESEEQKVGFLKEKIKIYEGLIYILFKLWERDRDPAKGYIQESYHVAERAKSRAFLDLIAEAKVRPPTGLSEELESKEKNLQSQLTNIQQNLLNPKIKEEEREELYQKLQGIESKYNDFILELREKSLKYASFVYPEPYTLDKVQQEVLDEKTFMIEFFIGEENSFSWVISQNEILWSNSFPNMSELFGKITSYQTQISQRKINFDLRLGKELFDILLKDALKKVPVPSHLIIIPDGILLRFPIEALVTEIKNGTPRYLLEDFILSYAPSASLLGEIRMFKRAEISEPMDLLALGNPAIEEEGEEVSDAVEFLRSSGIRLSPLPYAEEEVSAINEIYQDKGKRTKVYIKEDASEEAVKSGNIGSYKSIHFATHGLIDDRVPALSGILLAPSKDPEGDDGFLRMNEIFNLGLNADLVTLSACETALGKEVRGEGMISLTRAFFYAGARSILASLWMVSDQSTSKLMEDFYLNLVEGTKPREALRLAKINLLKSENSLYKHPFFWAPFIFIGID